MIYDLSARNEIHNIKGRDGLKYYLDNCFMALQYKTAQFEYSQPNNIQKELFQYINNCRYVMSEKDNRQIGTTTAIINYLVYYSIVNTNKNILVLTDNIAISTYISESVHCLNKAQVFSAEHKTVREQRRNKIVTNNGNTHEYKTLTGNVFRGMKEVDLLIVEGTNSVPKLVSHDFVSLLPPNIGKMFVTGENYLNKPIILNQLLKQKYPFVEYNY